MTEASAGCAGVMMRHRVTRWWDSHAIDRVLFDTSSTMSNNSAIHETVQRLNTELENADLLLLKSKPKFLSKKTHDDQDWPISNDGPDALLPAGLAANVEFQKASESLRLPMSCESENSIFCSEIPAEPQVQIS